MEKHLLLVDDESEIASVFKHLLENLYSAKISGGELVLHTAMDGVEAILACSRVTPALILMDVNLPVVDGIEAFYKIKKNNNDVAVKTYFITAYAGRGTVSDRLRRAIEDGALGYLTKPVSVFDLKQVIEEHVFAT